MDTERESALRADIAKKLGIAPQKLETIGTNALLEMATARADELMANSPALPAVLSSDALRDLYTKLAEVIAGGAPLQHTTCGAGTIKMARDPAGPRLKGAG